MLQREMGYVSSDQKPIRQALDDKLCLPGSTCGARGSAAVLHQQLLTTLGDRLLLLDHPALCAPRHPNTPQPSTPHNLQRLGVLSAAGKFVTLSKLELRAKINFVREGIFCISLRPWAPAIYNSFRSVA